jgi:hypothetical protein
MTATYTFDAFPASTATAPTAAATGATTGVSKAPSCSTTALPCTTRSDGLRGQHLSAICATAGPEHRGVRRP